MNEPTLPDRGVWELDDKGARLLYAAGTPEAEEFSRKYGDPEQPVDLAPAEPADLPEPDPAP